MRLQLDILKIKNVTFGDNTVVKDSVLYINKPELIALLRQDQRLSQVDIELAHPGENVRIAQVFDVVEPRTKTNGGENFPGVLGKQTIAGEGNTRVLRGTAIASIDLSSDGAVDNIIDMAGPGAKLGIFGKTHNICLLTLPANGISRHDYQHAMRIAGLKAAVCLAEAGKNIPADEVEVYDLGPLVKPGNGVASLPRIVYIAQIQSLSYATPQVEPIFYGDNVKAMLPTIVHPNEILDGGLLRNYWTRGQELYTVQNHPIVREMYRLHDKELIFAGVIVYVAQSTEAERERTVIMVAKLARHVLAADGAILTKIGGGAPHIDLGQVLEKCEEYGVKTTALVQDNSFDGTAQGALLFNSPRASAIVNTGSYNRPLLMPAVDKVIGRQEATVDGMSVKDEMNMINYKLCGAMNQIGATGLRVQEI